AWGIPTEVNLADSGERTRAFTLKAGGQREDFYLTYLRCLGANKQNSAQAGGEPGIRFAVWAPNARAVELVFANLAHGYVADDRTGAINAPGEFPMSKDAASGIWSIDSSTHPALGTFASRDHRAFYMFQITRDDGSRVLRTDLYSRCQVGRGEVDP